MLSMSHRLCGLTLVFIVCVGVNAKTDTFTSLRTEEDVRVSALANQRAIEICSKVDLSEVDRAEGREYLTELVGDSNFMLEAMQEAEDNDEFKDKLREKISPMSLIRVTFALVLALVLVFAYCICCWTACPCCRRCRCESLCGRKERSAPRIARIVIFFLLFCCMVAMIACCFVAYSGKEKVEAGMESVSCTAARVLNYTLNGHTGEKFVGMIPLLDRFGMLRTLLDDNSQFVTDVHGIMNSTVDLEKASDLAAEAIKALRIVLDQRPNVHPPVSDAAERPIHKCELCEALNGENGPLAKLSETLSASAATALTAARKEVDNQLSPAGRAQLRATFDDSMKPIRESADTVRDTTGYFLQDDFVEMKNWLLLLGSQIVLGISIAVFATLFCGCVSGGLLFREKNEEAPEHVNPWNKWIAPCACTTWCWGFLYAFIVLFIGGVLSIAAVPLSGMCLIMDDVDGTMLKSVLPGLGVPSNSSDNMLNMTADMIDMCFSRSTPPSTATLADILASEVNGTYVTVRQQVKNQVTGRMEAQFRKVSAAMSGNTVPLLMNDSKVSGLIDTLQNTPITATIMTQAANFTSLYAGIAMDPTGNLQVGGATSMYCDNFTSDGDALPAGVIPGTAELLRRMKAFTSSPAISTTPVGNCVNRVVCNKDPSTGAAKTCPDSTDPVCAACEAANHLMNLKAEVQSLSVYRCDGFVDKNNNNCDFKTMSLVDGKYINDCLHSDGAGAFTLKRVARTCTLPQFTAYMQDWGTRLEKVFERIDHIAPALGPKIQQELQGLITEHVSNPVDDIVDATHCSFLKEEYKDLVTGMCYKGVLGFHMIARSYNWNGFFSVLLIIISYGIWRHSVDNRNFWKAAHQDCVLTAGGEV